MSDPGITPATAAERAAALAFIIGAQARPATATAYLGDTAEGVEAELEGLEQPWLDTLRLARDAGRVVGAVAIEWDVDTTRAWVHGPWVVPERYDELAEALVRAAAAQCPAEIVLFELCGHVENTAMAALAQRLGWTPTRANHALTIPAVATASWPRHASVREATAADLPAVTALHTAAFPDAYATARQVLDDDVTLVADHEGSVIGYAAGQLQADGQAYVDFMAVDPTARGRGWGRALMETLAHRLVASGRPDRLHLTVDEERLAARALYQSLGMREDAVIRGYRGPLATQVPGAV